MGWEVYDCESGDHAANLLERTLWSEKCVNDEIILHSDRSEGITSLFAT
ncbi:transposase [Alteromonas mediterranea UM7]|nr:transposase [Alteromonas mediterranea UM7]